MVWNAGNDGSGSGLDADTLDGLQLGTGRNNSANQVVRTNVHGYIDAGYINTSCDDTGTGVDCKFYASQDDYIRYIDKASMRSVVNSPARSSAYPGRESYTTNTAYWMGTMGHGADNFDTTVWDYGSGAFDVWSNPSGQPSGTSHWCGLQSMHYTNGSARYGMRITCGAGQTALAYIQGRWGTTTYGWHKLWNEGNDGSGSGLDADTVDGIQASSFLRADTSDTVSGGPWQLTNTNSSWAYRFVNSTGTNNSVYMAHGVHGVHIRNDSCTTSGYLLQVYGSNGTDFKVRGGDALATSGGNTMWHAGNDGSSSGLDADTCDGQHLSTTSNVTFMSLTALSIVANAAFFLGDDKPIKFGNTEAAPDATIDWHTPSWGDRLEINVPTHGDIYYMVGHENDYHVFKNEGDTRLAIKDEIYVHRHIIPASDNFVDLGTSDKRLDDIYATSGTVNTSDRNEKNTIVDTDLGLSFVNKLKPVSYKFNNKTRTHYGLIAQDVETLLSDISKPTTDFAGFIKTENPDEVYNKLDKEDGKIPEGKDIGDVKKAAFTSYGLRYNEFIAPLIKAVQELSAEVETLKTKVSTLESA